MKVLDINSTCCWSFHGPNEDTIQQLRAAVQIADAKSREAALAEVQDGKAFGFVGEASTLDFATGFFDEVNLNFDPKPQKRVALRQCMRRWSKRPVKTEVYDEEESETSLVRGFRKLFARMTPSYATE
ncbi:MAG TPA: hypothetical protein VM735_01850 [Candidatus Kapabacteria bacterium]|nr:hypothetical protein [Candidatus Kapabacteria bacterium]